jgi:group I intron endonuclease
MDTKLLIYLYMYRHKVTGKAYVGVTKEPKRRFKKHAKGESAAIAFNRAVKKYGIDSFEFSILAMFDDVEAANYHENAAISAFGTLSPSGYNLIGGSPSSKYHGAMSQEIKAKISVANRGMSGWNKGKKMSAGFCEKLSAAKKGKPLSNAARIAHLKAITGKPLSLECRAKISVALKGKSHQDRGKPMSPENKAKISAALKGRKFSPEHCEKIRQRMVGNSLSLKTRKKLSEAHLGKKATSETREKMSLSRKKYLADPEVRMKISRYQMGNTHHLGKSASQETRAKMSRSQQERREKTSAAVKAFWNKKKLWSEVT